MQSQLRIEKNRIGYSRIQNLMIWIKKVNCTDEGQYDKRSRGSIPSCILMQEINKKRDEYLLRKLS